MAKARKCYVIGNTRYGHCSQPVQCKSIKEAKEVGKQWWAYRIYDAETNAFIQGGTTTYIHVL